MSQKNYKPGKTCQIPNLEDLYSRLFGDNFRRTFVEVGAYDGDSFSNTCFLADAGWAGLYVEPVPHFAEVCRKRHASNNVVVAECAVGPENRMIELFQGGTLTTPLKRQVEMYDQVDWAKGHHQGKTLEVRQYRLDDLLTQHKVSPRFDLLVVDVEGYETEVFESFDLEFWRPKVMIVELEDDHPSFKDFFEFREKCTKLRNKIQEAGYVEKYKDHINTVFVDSRKNEMLIPFSECKKEIGNVDAVVHIGAHHAEEAESYQREGVKKVFWVEADANLEDIALQNSKNVGLETVGSFGFAVFDQDDLLLDLNITNNSQASSVMGLENLQSFYPQIKGVEKRKIKTKTMRSLFSEKGLDFSEFQFVNIDIQGAELFALKGFGDLLHELNLKGIYLEVNYEELYNGTPLVDEIDKYLAGFGFYRKMTKSTDFSWGDALYVRKPVEDVSLMFSNADHRGPGSVVQTLKKGLTALNSLSETSERVGLLQPSSSLKNTPENALVGPNVMVLPPDEPEVIGRFSHFVVPSQWTKDLYESFPEMSGKTIKVWSAGIDTEKWKPSRREKDLDCFIYFKNRSEKELSVIQSLLTKFGFTYETLRYGSYQESDLMDLCNRSSFCVLLNGTESQGMAVMQIMSMNVPLLVFDQSTWSGSSRKGEVVCPATSIPYFDGRCGFVAPNHLDANLFRGLKPRMKNFKPREYILENHTVYQSAGRYLECFASK